ncbi:Mctp2 [Symbiodinium sp. CCMP2456]|nr:Mctp2 [Symbiodinium sp. CCMP2456]
MLTLSKIWDNLAPARVPDGGASIHAGSASSSDSALYFKTTHKASGKGLRPRIEAYCFPSVGGSFGDLPSGLDLATDSPQGFLPPTATIKSTEESPILPPHGTQNFGSRNLPPQGTLSPNAMADLMPTPPSQQGYLGGTPQSLGYGDLSLGDDRDREAKKKKKKKKDPGPSQDEDLSRTREAQNASPLRQRELLQLPQEKRRERARPSEEQDDSSLPTYVPAATRAGAALTGSLEGSKLLLRILRAYNLRNTDLGILPEDASDPFAVARIGPKDFKTHVVENSLNPIWNSQQFEFTLQDEEEPKLQLEVFSSNHWHANDSLGRLDIPIRSLTPGETHTVEEMLDEGDVVREDRKRPRIQVEVQLLCPDQLANPSSRQKQFQHNLALQESRKKKENMVPLPSFKGFGPEALARPDHHYKVAEIGEARRLNEYESSACRLGQYDYSGPPPYFPRQQMIDKRQWKDDPFFGWRRELNRAEHKMGHLEGPGPNLELEEVGEAWKGDPFHAWRSHQQGPQEGNIEQLQEARAARNLMSLPSFSEVPARRFNDHREYSDHVARPQPQLAAGRTTNDAPEQRWKDDAFYGWLPGRGPIEEEQHRLRRPLEQARLARLPSFAEGAPELAGVTGRGVGILTLWINAASNLAYSHGSGLYGTPSPCVKVSMQGQRGRASHAREKMTPTIARNRNPQWNTPAMVLEVHSVADVLQLEVLDLANPRVDEHIHHYFLGRAQLPIQRIIAAVHRSKNPSRPLQLRESLEGSQAQAQIDFECIYEAYDTEASPASQTLSPPRDRDRFQSQLSASPQSSPGQSKRQSSDMGGLGILSVRIIAAYNLVNADTGILGDVSDPYVTVRLESQSEKQRKRTHTINNDLNPKWNSSPFLFPIQHPEDQLLLEVYDEDMMGSDDFLGRMKIPLYRIIHGRANQPVRIRDQLQDIETGELELEIGFSPG